ncbi:hypothetical protein AX16_006878 [Volvariella volvacea WC 439]|nr:hypothetical protein AX16_006878 [Volvariella volvacea WC 439]
MSTTTNPSHILIARNSRGHNPAASLSSPTETHAAAAGIFRSSSSPPFVLEECDEADESVSELDIGETEEAIELDETFTKNSRFPGTVKIVVESTTFWAHKEVLFFASPFFEAALSGNWSETSGGRPQSVSSIITISQPPTSCTCSSIHHTQNVKSARDKATATTEMMTLDPDTDPDLADTHVVYHQHSTDSLGPSSSLHSSTVSSVVNSEAEQSDSENRVSSKEEARKHALEKLQSGGSARMVEGGGDKARKKDTTKKAMASKQTQTHSSRKVSPAQAMVKRRPKNGPDAVIVLKEEKASTFHDFLKFVYPHLECTITWNNVESLMNISHKLCVPALQRECLNFLLTHAAGRPIKAMRIAELFEEEELYRESSRFVLDNPGGWSEHELNTLTKETLLKLEKRRNWFLERVLKLGLTMVAKEYQCCPTCPDPPTCARLLEEKWRQAYHAVFRFGPPQPSMVYRYLRMLEGVSPPLSLMQTACQASAKAFTATLFDRMFSLGVRGSGADAAPLNARGVAAAAASGPRRHFLYCTLKPEPAPQRPRRSRDAT